MGQRLIRRTSGFDVEDTGDALRLTTDLSGVSETDLEVSIDFDRLMVHGRGSGGRQLMRAFTLPRGCNPDDIAAELTHGTLTVTVPKPTAHA